MRLLAERLGIRAPSLYKHFANRDEIKSELVARGLREMGEALHDVLDAGGSSAEVLAVYRATGARHPNLYRLATTAPLDRAALPDGLEEWSGSAFWRMTGDPDLAQALWSFAHGAMILELDGRYPPGSDLDRIWDVGVELFVGRSG